MPAEPGQSDLPLNCQFNPCPTAFLRLNAIAFVGLHYQDSSLSHFQLETVEIPTSSRFDTWQEDVLTVVQFYGLRWPRLSPAAVALCLVFLLDLVLVYGVPTRGLAACLVALLPIGSRRRQGVEGVLLPEMGACERCERRLSSRLRLAQRVAQSELTANHPLLCGENVIVNVACIWSSITICAEQYSVELCRSSSAPRGCVPWETPPVLCRSP